MSIDTDNEAVTAYVKDVLASELRCMHNVTPDSVRQMVREWEAAYDRLLLGMPQGIAASGITALCVTHLARAFGSELFTDKT